MVQIPRRHAVAMFVAGAALTFAPAAFAAGGKAHVEVMMLHASNGPVPGSIDAAIDEGKPAKSRPSLRLKEAPLSAWNTFKLKGRQILVLEEGKPSKMTLPNGRVLQVTLVKVVADKETRYTISTSIDQPEAGAFLKLLEFTAKQDATTFVAGMSLEKGASLILALTPVAPVAGP